MDTSICGICQEPFGTRESCYSCGSPREESLGNLGIPEELSGKLDSTISICGICKEPFGPGDFCINCGSSLEDSLAEIVMPREKREKLEKRKAFRRRHRGKFRLLAFFGVMGIAYGGAHFAIDASSGPEATIQRYADAIQSPTIEVLNDQTLFPGGKASQLSSILLEARVPGSLGEVGFKDVNRDGYRATATIVTRLGTQNLELQAERTWQGIFAVPEWSVLTQPKTIDFSLKPAPFGVQELFLGNSKTSAGKEKVDALSKGGSDVGILPGLYSFSLGKAGFYAETDDTFTVWDGKTPGSISVASKTNSIPPSDSKKIKEDAAALAKKCVKSKCSKLAKPGEYDFDLWLQFGLTGYSYTSSKFDRSYEFKRCDAPKLVVSSPTEATATTNCTYTVEGHLYVRYTYYRGWYTDYWYYWDFYDTIDKTIRVSTPLLTNLDGNKISVGKADYN